MGETDLIMRLIRDSTKVVREVGANNLGEKKKTERHHALEGKAMLRGHRGGRTPEKTLSEV